LRDRADFSVCMCECGGGDDFLRAPDPFPEPALVPLPLLPRGPWGFRGSNVGGAAAATARATGGAGAGPGNDVDAAAIVAVERAEWECECECECEWACGWAWDCEWWWWGEKSGPGRLLRDAGGE